MKPGTTCSPCARTQVPACQPIDFFTARVDHAFASVIRSGEYPLTLGNVDAICIAVLGEVYPMTWDREPIYWSGLFVGQRASWGGPFLAQLAERVRCRVRFLVCAQADADARATWQSLGYTEGN